MFPRALRLARPAARLQRAAHSAAAAASVAAPSVASAAAATSAASAAASPASVAASSYPIRAPRSESKSATLSVRDATARNRSFLLGIDQMQRLWRAHENHPADAHIQVVIDCAYEGTRSTHSLANSLANQVTNAVGVNRSALWPAKLVVTQFPCALAGESLWPRLYDPWFQPQSACGEPTLSDADRDVLHLVEARRAAGESFEEFKHLLPLFVRALLVGDARFNNPSTPSKGDQSGRRWKCAVDPRSLPELYRADKVTYLTPDSPNILQEVSTERVYAIGGLVDKTVVRGVSLARAKALGCAHARLPVFETVGPIAKRMSLNIDSVFGIVLDMAQAQRKQRSEDEANPAALQRTPTANAEILRQQWLQALNKHIPDRYWTLNKVPRRETSAAASATAANVSANAAS